MVGKLNCESHFSAGEIGSGIQEFYRGVGDSRLVAIVGERGPAMRMLKMMNSAIAECSLWWKACA